MWVSKTDGDLRGMVQLLGIRSSHKSSMPRTLRCPVSIHPMLAVQPGVAEERKKQLELERELQCSHFVGKKLVMPDG